MGTIRIKRIYDTPLPADGYRMLVDRLWPRGMTKDAACLDEWNKTIAPSTGIRKFFGHKPEHFDRLAEDYRNELKQQPSVVQRSREIAKDQKLTLLYAARDPQIKHVRVLLSILLAN